MGVKLRISIEKQIFAKTVDTLLAAGYTLRLHDGEEFCTSYTTNRDVIINASMSTDEDTLYVYNGDGVTGSRVGWVLFIYGNDGYDVISDHTINLDEYIKPSMELADQLEDKYEG